MRIVRRIIIFVCAICCYLSALSCYAVPGLPNVLPDAPPESLQSYIALEQDTQQILTQQNISELIDASLLARMMSVIVVLEATVDGKSVSVTDMISPVSNSTSSDGYYTLYASRRYSVDILIKASLLANADNCSRALAYYVNPNTEYFVTLMNQTAARLGMTNTYFTNVDGSASSLQRTTAYDMALFYTYALRNAQFRKIVSLEVTHIWDSIAIFNPCSTAFTAKEAYNATVAGGLVLSGNAESNPDAVSTMIMNITLPATDVSSTYMRLVIVYSANASEDIAQLTTNILTDCASNYSKRKVVSGGEVITTYSVADQTLSILSNSDLYCVMPVDLNDYVQSISYSFDTSGNTTGSSGTVSGSGSGSGGSLGSTSSERLELTPPIIEHQVLGTARYLLRDGSTHTVTIIAGNTIQTESQTVNRLLDLIETYKPLFIIVAVLILCELFVLFLKVTKAIRVRRSKAT